MLESTPTWKKSVSTLCNKHGTDPSTGIGIPSPKSLWLRFQKHVHAPLLLQMPLQVEQRCREANLIQHLCLIVILPMLSLNVVIKDNTCKKITIWTETGDQSEWFSLSLGSLACHAEQQMLWKLRGQTWGNVTKLENDQPCLFCAS